MSRRAAARLESFGLENICVYVAGKQDWLAFDLPFEGSLAETRTAGTSAIKDMPVCGPLDKIAEVRRRAEQADWQECVVVNETRVVLGLLEKEALGANDELPVEEVMDPAPLTLRPYFEIRHGENARAKNCGCPGDQAGRQVSRPVKTKQDSLAYRAIGKMSTAADRWTDTLHRSSVPSLWPKCAAIRRDSRLIGEVVTEHSRMLRSKRDWRHSHRERAASDNSS